MSNVCYTWISTFGFCWLENLMVYLNFMWRRGVAVFTTVQLHSAKPELGFCASSNPAHGVSEIRDSENLWQWSWLERRLSAFRRSTIPQKQFIIIIHHYHHRDFFEKKVLLTVAIWISKKVVVYVQSKKISYTKFIKNIYLQSEQLMYRRMSVSQIKSVSPTFSYNSGKIKDLKKRSILPWS